MPKMKVVGQTVQPGEFGHTHRQTDADGRYQVQYLPALLFINKATWSIIICQLWEAGLLYICGDIGSAMTKYIKTCTELSHPGCLLLQFYAFNHVLINYMQE